MDYIQPTLTLIHHWLILVLALMLVPILCVNLHGACISFCCCCKIIPNLVTLNNTVDYLTVLWVTSLIPFSLDQNQGVSQAVVLSGSSRGESVSWPLPASGGCLRSLVWIPLPPSSQWVKKVDSILSYHSDLLFCHPPPLLGTTVITLGPLG